MYQRTKTSGLAVVLIALFALFLTTALPVEAAEIDTDSTTATVTFKAGALKILAVPELEFGEQDILGEEAAYTTTSITPVEISDLRGSNSGWNLVVSLSSFKSGEVASLQGAYIEIKSATVNAKNDTISTAPTVANSSIKLNANDTQTLLLGAETGAGSGVWQMEMLAANVSLKVAPGTAVVGQNAATLNWSLQTTP